MLIMQSSILWNKAKLHTNHILNRLGIHFHNWKAKQNHTNTLEVSDSYFFISVILIAVIIIHFLKSPIEQNLSRSFLLIKISPIQLSSCTEAKLFVTTLIRLIGEEFE